MSGKIYKDQFGVEIGVVVKDRDISSATVHNLLVRKPSGVEVTWAASIVGENILRYVTVSGDLDEEGMYYVTPQLTIGSWSGQGTPGSFTVYNKWR
jgi:hypothetical protein